MRGGNTPNAATVKFNQGEMHSLICPVTASKVELHPVSQTRVTYDESRNPYPPVLLEQCCLGGLWDAPRNLQRIDQSLPENQEERDRGGVGVREERRDHQPTTSGWGPE
jgi:hypothetical protein